MKKVIYEDLYELNFLSGVKSSPEGNHVLFVKQNADKEKNGYKAYVKLIDTKTGEISCLTTSGEDRNPQWLDEETILFTSKREKVKKDETAFYTLNIKGGEAEKKFILPYKASSLKPLGNNKYAFLATKKCVEEEKKSDIEAKEGEDFYVFDEIYFWANGEGIRNKIRDSLMIYDEEKNETVQISPKFTQVAAYSLSQDKKKILYVGHTYENVFRPESGLYLYDIEKNETTTVVEEGKFGISSPLFMGNDKAFFALNKKEFAGQNSYFCVLDMNSLEYKILPYGDFPVGGSVGTDVNYGSGQDKLFYDGKVYMTIPTWGKSVIISFDERGEYEVVLDKEGSLNTFDIKDNILYVSAMLDEKMTEIYSYNLETKEFKRLTNANTLYHETHSVAPIDYFTFKNREGIELDGFVIKPVGYEKGKKYPGVFEIHGGPKTIFGRIFHHEMQVLANKGYFVFYTNPRGSDGRGSDFANLTGKLGTIDFYDLMDFYDEVLRRYPDLDEKHVGICGGSYGGFMCNWMIGHTDRFSAAASQRSISNYLTKSLTTDIGYYHNMQQLTGTPWTNFDEVWETSPLKNAPLAKTPTLFIQSDEDYRCWMSDALQMYTALKLNGTDAKVALFHKEHHGLSRVGRPENRIGRLTEICSWFDKYLK